MSHNHWRPAALRRAMKQRNLSMADLARKGGWSHSTVSDWYAGHKEPSAANRRKLRKFFPELAEAEGRS